MESRRGNGMKFDNKFSDKFDPMNSEQDDFEFKPLTEGLGFHPKQQEASEVRISHKTHAKMTFNDSLDSQLNQISQELGAGELNSPLPRKKDGKKPAAPLASNSNNTVDEILKTLNEKRNFDFNDKKQLHEPVAATFKPSRFDLSAALLDGMLVTAATLLCLIILLVVTRVDLFANLYNPDSQGLIYLSLVALVAGIAWIYLVGNRVFLGFTPGEWVFDQRLGRPEQTGTAGYALSAIFRATAVIATGFILFPLFSFLFNRDLIGKLTGAELMKKA